MSETLIRDTESLWFLQPEDPSYSGKLMPIAGPVTLGRESSCDIVLHSKHASRAHARLWLENGKLFVEDLNSANGSYLNGKRITKSELAAGDTLRFDTLTFQVVSPAVRVEQATVVRAAPADDKPAKRPAAAENPKAQSGGDGGPSRRAWWEKAEEGPKGTRFVDASELAQKAAGGTMIVSSVVVERPSLICVSPPYTGQVFRLKEGKTTLGRASSNDIVLEEDAISSTHAHILFEGNTWKIVDLLSANGTFVNGKKTQVAFLSPGDGIKLGRIELRFVIGSEMAEKILKTLKPAPGMKIGAPAAVGQPAAKRIPGWFFIVLGFIVALALGGAFLLTR